MELNIIVDEYSMNINLPDDFLSTSHEIFDRLDREMDQGIQLGRQWVKNPDQTQRCQMAANKLLTALETDNESLAMISAGYIISRLPGVRGVTIDNSGEMSGTDFRF